MAIKSETLFFSRVIPRKLLCAFLISPTDAAHSFSSFFTGAKLPVLLSSVLKMEAVRPFETLTCTYQTATLYQNPAEKNIIVALRYSNHKSCTNFLCSLKETSLVM
jgi:hypothetical protein